MITRNEIRSIPEIYKSIERDAEQLMYLREKATAVPSGLSDQERVQTSPNNNAMKYIDAAVDLRRELDEKANRLLDLQDKALAFIDSLPTNTDTERLTVRVLKFRYINCCTWDEVADLTGYVVRWVQQIEQDATRNL